MSSTLQVLIGAVDKTTSISDLVWESGVCEVGSASFTVSDPTGTYVPADDAAVQVYVDGVLRWAGEVAEVDAEFLGWELGVVSTVVAHDNSQLPQRGDPTNGTIPGQSLKTTLAWLVGSGGPLHALGITLDPSQAAGPTAEAMTCAYTTPNAILERLSALTGWLWAISPARVLSMWDVGDHVSGVTLSPANGNVTRASWTRHRFDYRNRQWLVYGPTETRQVTDHVHGDGSTHVFPLRYGVASPPRSCRVMPNNVRFSVGTYGVGSPTWSYRASDRALVQVAGATPLTTSQYVEAVYPSAFPNVAYAHNASEEGVRGPWAATESDTGIVDYDEALAEAEARIRKGLVRPQDASIETTADGIEPGDTVVVSLPVIGLTATCFVQRVKAVAIAAEDDIDLEWTVSVVSGDERTTDSAAIWRRLIMGETASSGAPGGISGGGSTWTGSATPTTYPLTGTAPAGVKHTTWVRVPNCAPVRLDGARWGDRTVVALVRAYSDTAGVTVRPRIWNDTKGESAGEGVPVTPGADAWSAYQSIVLNVDPDGEDDYYLEVLPGSASAFVNGDGYVEAGL